MARVLVLVDLKEGLLEEMELGDGEENIRELDYEGVPFRCHHFH